MRPDGSVVVWAIANMTVLRDEAGHAVAWLGQSQDITERRSLEDRLRRLADEDALTSVPNRRSFEESVRLTLELCSRHEIAGSLLLIDLDGFKAINDTHGHAVGDHVLAAVAAALRARLRATDLVARVGGDEFAVLLRATSGQDARDVADALARVVGEISLGEGAPDLVLGASVGVADFGCEAIPTVEALLASADSATSRPSAPPARSGAEPAAASPPSRRRRGDARAARHAAGRRGVRGGRRARGRGGLDRK